MALGPDLRQAREAQQITQKQLAAEMGVTQAAVSQWEAEDMPRHRFFEALAAIERIGQARSREQATARERALALAKERS